MRQGGPLPPAPLAPRRRRPSRRAPPSPRRPAPCPDDGQELPADPQLRRAAGPGRRAARRRLGLRAGRRRPEAQVSSGRRGDAAGKALVRARPRGWERGPSAGRAARAGRAAVAVLRPGGSRWAAAPRVQEFRRRRPGRARSGAGTMRSGDLGPAARATLPPARPPVRPSVRVPAASRAACGPPRRQTGRERRRRVGGVPGSAGIAGPSRRPCAAPRGHSSAGWKEPLLGAEIRAAGAAVPLCAARREGKRRRERGKLPVG